MIKDLLIRLNEYTEEPDAFETESERLMQKDLLDQLDKELQQKDQNYFFQKRNNLISSLEKYFKNKKFTRSVKILKDPNDKRYNYLQFWIPENKMSYMSKFKETSNCLKQGLNLRMDNSSEGFLITIF